MNETNLKLPRGGLIGQIPCVIMVCTFSVTTHFIMINGQK